ncbi:hypothetical protein QL285_035548 [Trifolium repens]|nr:hypothetical protein QL285_035548 [Trifolium repens]
MRNKGFVKLGINGTTSIESVKTQAASTSECPPPPPPTPPHPTPKKKKRSHIFGLVLESRYLEIFYKVYKPMELNRAHTPINYHQHTNCNSIKTASNEIFPGAKQSG